MCQFSHLHVHTQFSLLDGAASIDGLYKKAMNDNMPALAITDHGNMYGVFEFVSNAWKKTKVVGKDANGKDIEEPIVKPIVGCEFYVVEDRFKKSFTKGEKDERYHQVLLAKNKIGYQNLVKLTSLGFIEGMYSKYPRIDKKLIEQYHEGLIATTCCLGAYVPQTILYDGEAAAEEEFKWWLNLFGEDYFVEMQRHNIKEQNEVNPILQKFAKKYNVPIIASNDSHYTDKEDYNAHDILLCINTGEKQATPGYDDIVNDDLHVKNKRFKFANDQFYFKKTDEMKSLFADIPESIDNTNIIVDRVEVLNLKKDILLPAFPIPTEFQIHSSNEVIGKDIITPDVNNQWEYLKHLTYEGAKKRYGEIIETTRERIDFELFTIKTMGFAGYFLIVSDFIKAGRDMGVFIGPGRGSAAGSVVAYCIGITNIDPIKYNLLFERFLNPDRKSMPDIDTDFDDDGRQKVIDYVVKKYTKNQVAQIVTFGTMAAKSSIKDVARVMDLPLPESNALAKLVSDKPGTSLNYILHGALTKQDGEKSLEEKGYTPDDIENAKKIREIYNGDSNDLRTKVLKEAERLEGSVRNTGVHAAGIIIAPKDLTELIPVATAKDSDLWVTQIEGSVIEESGVIKMDFLGLRTLSILKTALELIKQNYNISIDLDELPLNDTKTYQLLQRGETNGIFQFESPGMQKYMRELKPDQLADLIAMNALYRPGPIAYIPKFIARKHGREPIEYDIPEMEEYLAETYGITVYQEQVMLLSQSIGGFTKGDADVLRKAMGKKQKAVLDKMKTKFIEGAVAKGHPVDKLEKVWTDWEAFAQYAFNKSHSTCYAFVAYQTAYLKAHYPSEFMSAVLNHSGNIEKITFFMEECKRMGIKVLGPDINESLRGFAPNKKGEIRFGLGGLKGVGDAAIDNIIEERKAGGAYQDIYNFASRVNARTVNKKTFESLAYSGTFDCFTDLHRAQYFTIADGEKLTGVEKIIQYAQSKHSASANSTNTLFGDLGAAMEIPKPKIANCEPWTLTDKLSHEKEITGMYMSGHPLDHYQYQLRYLGITNVKTFALIKDNININAQEEANAQPAPAYNNNTDENNGNEDGDVPEAAAQEVEDLIDYSKFENVQLKVSGLIVDAQHRVGKTGKSFAIITIEDFTGKCQLPIWNEDYIKYHHYFEKGVCILMSGAFRKKWASSKTADFALQNIMLLSTAKATLTKHLDIFMYPQDITPPIIQFLQNNIQNNPGNTSVNIKIINDNLKSPITLYNNDVAITVTDELTDFFVQNNAIAINVQTM